VTASLGRRTGSNVLLNEFPLFAVSLESIEESEMLINGPATRLLTLRRVGGTGVNWGYIAGRLLAWCGGSDNGLVLFELQIAIRPRGGIGFVCRDTSLFFRTAEVEIWVVALLLLRQSLFFFNSFRV